MNHHSSMNHPMSSSVSLEAIDPAHRRLNPLTGEWVLIAPPGEVQPWLEEQQRADEQDDRIASEDAFQRKYFRTHGTRILHAYAVMELRCHERIVAENDTWVALVPFWAHHPFEAMLLPRRPVERFSNLTEAERNHLAEMLERLEGGYESLFGDKHPCRLEWHGAPRGSGPARHWQLHVHFQPSATPEAMRNMVPEAAAEALRNAIS